MEIDEAECEDYLCTSEPYFTFQGEEFVKEEREHVAEIMSHAEVPGKSHQSIEIVKLRSG